MEFSEKTKKYHKFYEDTFKEAIGIKNLEIIGTNKKLPWLKNAARNIKIKYGSIWRNESMETMKYGCIPNKTNYICTIFSITRKGKSSIEPIKGIHYSTTHSFLYTTCRENKLYHEFICTATTLTSADGEYRSRFISYDQYQKCYNKFIDMLNQMEHYVMKQIKNGDLLLHAKTIYPHDFSSTVIKNKMDNFINESRLSLKLYITLWFMDFYRMNLNILENHVSPGYIESMFSGNDNHFYSKNKEKFNANQNLISYLTEFSKPSVEKRSSVGIGQKLIPLTVKQIEDIGQIHHPVWLELFISSYVGDLVINGISSNFSIFNNWFLLQGNNSDLFNNQVAHIRFQNSDVAKKIIKKLEESRRDTFRFDPTKNEYSIRGHNMEGLAYTIEIPIDYAEEEIIMSNYTLCFLTEYIGRTVWDIPILYKNEKWASTLGPILVH